MMQLKEKCSACNSWTWCGRYCAAGLAAEAYTPSGEIPPGTEEMEMPEMPQEEKDEIGDPKSSPYIGYVNKGHRRRYMKELMRERRAGDPEAKIDDKAPADDRRQA